MKKILIAFLSLVCVALTACSKESILVDTQTLRVEKNGTQTIIYDLAGKKEYSYKTVRVRKDKVNNSKNSRISASTDTIRIVAITGGGFLIEDYTANVVYLVEKDRTVTIPG